MASENFALTSKSKVYSLTILPVVWRVRRYTKPPATTCGKQGQRLR